MKLHHIDYSDDRLVDMGQETSQSAQFVAVKKKKVTDSNAKNEKFGRTINNFQCVLIYLVSNFRKVKLEYANNKKRLKK